MSLNETILKIIMASAERESTTHPLIFVAKLGEEFGEFCEAALQETGYNQHKLEVGHPVLEAADIIQVVLIVLQRLYPKKSPAQLLNEIEEAMEKKFQKYLAISTKLGGGSVAGQRD